MALELPAGSFSVSYLPLGVLGLQTHAPAVGSRHQIQVTRLVQQTRLPPKPPPQPQYKYCHLCIFFFETTPCCIARLVSGSPCPYLTVLDYRYMPHTRTRLLVKEKKSTFTYLLGVCVCMWVWEHMCDTGQHAGIRSALLSYNSRDQTQVIKLVGKCLYPLGYPAGPWLYFLLMRLQSPCR